MGNNSFADDPLNPWIRGFIREQAQRVVRGAQLPRYEQEDVEGELRAHFLRGQKSFDPRRGQWNTFARAVIERKASVLLATGQADCRARAHEAYSIDAPVRTTDGSEVQGTERFDADTYRHRIGPAGGSLEDRWNQQLDVADTIKKLRPGDQHIARLLMEKRVAEVARETGIPRGTVYEAIGRIRRSFETDGLNDPRHRRHFGLRSSK